MKKLWLMVLGLGIICFSGSAHAVSSGLRLEILPKLCEVDVVQDGIRQHIQSASSDCRLNLAQLLAPSEIAGGSSRPGFALPFAGASSEPVQQPQYDQIDDSSATIIAREGDRNGLLQPDKTVSMMVFSIAVVAAAVVIDLILFELHYSRVAGRWLRQRTRLGRK